ncbi:MAG: hypothetical protein DMD81_07720 [Candidatus Rokuibacteriota bacterium]|nr:MAG: hypothetical protein DMD81_07720 [Candidatus Rokubacteria bacterium]
MDRGRLIGNVVPREDLSAQDVAGMYRVFRQLYEGVDEKTFHDDLEEKDWVLLLRDVDSGAIRGFTTILRLQMSVHGEPLNVVFSGDTGIAPECWGGQALVRAWAHFMGRLRALDPSRRLYWFLISKGYRTYLYLPFFFHRFWPCVGVETPAFETALIDELGRAKYPDHFDPATGVVRFAHSHGHLRRTIAETPRHRREHPHVRFFLEKNPGYARGNELVCVAELAPENMKGLAQRLLLEGSGALLAAS